jgi:hypothetical protein
MSEETDGQQLPDSALPEANTLPTAEEKPAGYYPVDLDDLPEEKRQVIEDRFKYMYGQIKGNERKLNEFRGIAQSQSEKIEELMNGVGQVVDHLQNKSFAENELSIRQQMKAAHESGDTDSFISLNEKLTEIKARKIALEKPRDKEKTEPRKYDSASDMANDAVSDGEINTEEGRTISVWQDEKDASGQSLRPWAKTRNPKEPTADPLYRRALIEAAAVFDEASPFAGKTTAEKLAEVDRRMGLTRNSNSQTVIGGQLTNARKPQKLTLSPDAQRLALKIGKGKNDTEKLDWYRKQLEKTNSKGARK